MGRLTSRVIGALALRPAVFEDVEHDTGANVQAAFVVALAHVAQSVAVLSALQVGPLSRDVWVQALPGMLLAVVVGLLGWMISAGVLLFVGTKLFPVQSTEADFGQLLRTLGFAESAGLLCALALIPVGGAGSVLILLTSVWILVAMVVAVRQALDYDTTGRAILVCVVAWVLLLAISLVAQYLGLGTATVSGRLV